MAKGGFSGLGGGNMNNLIMQAQRMQQQLAEKKEAIDNKEFKTSVGGGAVEAVITGKKLVKSINIKPEVVDPDDVEMLQDLILSAINEAMKQVDAETEKELGQLTGGMNIPGMF